MDMTQYLSTKAIAAYTNKSISATHLILTTSKKDGVEMSEITMRNIMKVIVTIVT